MRRTAPCHHNVIRTLNLYFRKMVVIYRYNHLNQNVEIAYLMDQKRPKNLKIIIYLSSRIYTSVRSPRSYFMDRGPRRRVIFSCMYLLNAGAKLDSLYSRSARVADAIRECYLPAVIALVSGKWSDPSRRINRQWFAEDNNYDIDCRDKINAMKELDPVGK